MLTERGLHKLRVLNLGGHEHVEVLHVNRLQTKEPFSWCASRWLLVEFIPCMTSGSATYIPPGDLNGKHIWNALKESVISNFGDIGWGAVGTSLTVKYFSPMTNLCIIRVARDHHRIAWGAVTLVKRLQGKPCIPNVIHVSGTIKHCQLAAIVHNREAVARLRALCKIPTLYQSKYDEYLQTSTREISELQD